MQLQNSCDCKKTDRRRRCFCRKHTADNRKYPKDKVNIALGEYRTHTERAENADYIRAVVKGVATHVDELDGAIERNAKGWKLNRLSRMTKAVLRLAIYEMRYVSDVPVGVAINEAVALDKIYDTEEAAAFINGVLGAVAREKQEKDETDA